MSQSIQNQQHFDITRYVPDDYQPLTTTQKTRLVLEIIYRIAAIVAYTAAAIYTFNSSCSLF